MTEYEEREAAAFASVSWPEYLALDRLDRAGIVAHFRVHSMVESHRNGTAVGAEVSGAPSRTAPGAGAVEQYRALSTILSAGGGRTASGAPTWRSPRKRA